MNEKKVVVADELLDADLKQILGKRYQDASHLFTEEAQERRRNNREVLTLRITAFMGTLMFGIVWAHLVGIMSTAGMCIGIGLCNLVIGYFAGVCVSHNKGWRD
jgi:hypothetical protein